MKKILETGLMIAAACGFFGFIYPELCLIEDTCKIVDESGYEKDVYDMGRFWEIYDLPPEKIRIKSRLLEYLCETDIKY